MGLGLRITLEPELYGRLEQHPPSSIYQMIDYWDHAEKRSVDMTFGGKEQTIQYTFAPNDFLHGIKPNETFGAYVGDMMFISQSLARERPDWVPYVIFKLYTEKFVPHQDDEGMKKHFQSMYTTLRVAGQVMGEEGLLEFLREFRTADQVAYLEYDEEMKKFLEQGGGTLLGAKKAYLKAHHKNKWVNRERELAKNGGVGDWQPGPSQTIFDALASDSRLDLYSNITFLREVRALEENYEVRIPEEYVPVAYILTEQGNGVKSVVEFVSESENVIKRVPKRLKTIEAVLKRLGHDVLQQEETAQKILKKLKQDPTHLMLIDGSSSSTLPVPSTPALAGDLEKVISYLNSLL